MRERERGREGGRGERERWRVEREREREREREGKRVRGRESTDRLVYCLAGRSPQNINCFFLTARWPTDLLDVVMSRPGHF